MSYSSMLNDYTLEELFETALEMGIVEETEEAEDFSSHQLVTWIRESQEELRAMDHYAGFYSY